MRILVTGATGYVGSRLAPRLQRDGHEVRGLTRGRHAREPAGVPMVRGDAVTGAGLAEALDRVQVAYFLIHSMEAAPGGDGAFSARERAAASNFARAAQAAGVERIVYLGGLVPTTGTPSAHLASRLAVEQTLLEAAPCSIAFRASIVIGAGSRSFRFLVHLVERLPLLAVPAWRTNRTRPIDERDVIELLARAATADELCGGSFDIAGPDTVTYEELIDRIRHHMYVGRARITFKRLTLTPIASRVAAVLAGEEHELIGPLMEGLSSDLLPRDDRAAELLGVRMHGLDRAIEHALRDWERTEPLAAR
ncbi:MAG: NAD(P)H-binding protein [Solirubrobacterales bacterium]|nr:NAD(P)H-binding protein [Solirubrobacterales bacterium]MBV9917927.1 NAD(P)H-binding protein [Solirubrobacterales bacterium]